MWLLDVHFRVSLQVNRQPSMSAGSTSCAVPRCSRSPCLRAPRPPFPPRLPAEDAEMQPADKQQTAAAAGQQQQQQQRQKKTRKG